MSAIQINQVWAGHPGSQILSGIGSNKAAEVWTKPLGNQRTAVMIINTVDKDPLAQALVTNDGLGLAPCDPSKQSQRWKLSQGVSPGDSVTTNIMTAANDTKTGKPDCIEIHACSTKENAGVSVAGGCKGLPTSCAQGSMDRDGATHAPFSAAVWAVTQTQKS